MKVRRLLSALFGVLAIAATAATQGAEIGTGRVSGVRAGPGAKRVEQGKPGPLDFGIVGDAVSTFHSSAFRPIDSTFGYTSDGFSEWPTSYSSGFGTFLVANLSVPEGAVIDYAVLNVCNSSGSAPPLVFGLSQNGVDFSDVQIPNLAGCNQFFSPSISLQIPINTGQVLDFFVDWSSGPLDGSVKIAGGEVWWHRAVSPAPGTATFADVPTTHPQFQFVEALVAAGITAGCGGGNYCPDQALTRGQMAVYLSVALGLHWTN